MRAVDVLVGINSLVGRYPLDYCKQLRYDAEHADLFDASIEALAACCQEAAGAVSRPTDDLQIACQDALAACCKRQSMLYHQQPLDLVLRKMQLCLDEQMLLDTLGHLPALDKASLRADVSACLESTEPRAITTFYTQLNQRIGPALLEAIDQDLATCSHALAQVIENDILVSFIEQPSSKIRLLLEPMSFPSKEQLKSCRSAMQDSFDQHTRAVAKTLKKMYHVILDTASVEHAELRDRIEALDAPDPHTLQALMDDLSSCLPVAQARAVRRFSEPFMVWFNLPYYADIIGHLHTWRPLFLEQPMWYRRMRCIVGRVLDNEERVRASRVPRWSWDAIPADVSMRERLWHRWMVLRPFWVLLANIVSVVLSRLGLPLWALLCQGLVLWGDAFRVYYKMRADRRSLRQHEHVSHWKRHRNVWMADQAPWLPPSLPKVCYQAPEDKEELDRPLSAYQASMGARPMPPALGSGLLQANLCVKSVDLSESWLQWTLQMAWDWGLLFRWSSTSGLKVLHTVIALLGVLLYLTRAVSLYRAARHKHGRNEHSARADTAAWYAQHQQNRQVLQASRLVLSILGAGLMLALTLVPPLQAWVALVMGCGLQGMGLLRERLKVVQGAQPQRPEDGMPLSTGPLFLYSLGLRSSPHGVSHAAAAPSA